MIDAALCVVILLASTDVSVDAVTRLQRDGTYTESMAVTDPKHVVIFDPSINIEIETFPIRENIIPTYPLSVNSDYSVVNSP